MLRPPALLHWFPELRNYCDAAMALAASISRGSFKRLQQRPRGERLCEIGLAGAGPTFGASGGIPGRLKLPTDFGGSGPHRPCPPNGPDFPNRRSFRGEGSSPVALPPPSNFSKPYREPRNRRDFRGFYRGFRPGEFGEAASVALDRGWRMHFSP